ncbi:MAG: DUF4365 domain-containing protein [Leptolyngbyaceae cyanobacterium bins.302]|nr:DUF4365 domain-containing protein [Leptolyngbyaceae cyanobacterium bins.302]
MKQDLQHFIGQRAEALAMVYLTRNQDLVINRMTHTHDYGIDLLVTIKQDDLLTGRIFGVQVKGRDKSFKNEDFLLPLNETPKLYLHDLPFPVCMLLFTMEDDKGYYRWVNYSGNQLSKNFESINQDQWCLLDTAAIERIVNDVNNWYAAKSHSAA